MSTQPLASSFSWLDFSEKDRRAALDAVSLLAEHETRDELGLGSIREAIADLLFPGTSTIQTRARYFLFIPWICLELERRRISSAKAEDYVRAREVKLIQALLASPDKDGLIGRQAKERLKRMPSNIYWDGLRRMGILQSEHGQSGYQRRLDEFYARQDELETNDEREAAAGISVRNWCADLPKPPGEFPEKANFRLFPDEAQFLQAKILARASGTMLAHLVGRGKPFPEVEFPWHHPHVASFPTEMRLLLYHAQNFSEMMHGVLLLYNLMLAEKTNRPAEISRYEKDLRQWAAQIYSRRADFSAWEIAQFWKVITVEDAGIPSATRRFVESVISQIDSPRSAKAAPSNQLLRKLIADREKDHKGEQQARLFDQRAQDRWSGESGTRPLDYRWRQAQRIILDIVGPLAAGNDHA